MANATHSHRCCFHWEIFNPFLPPKKFEAIFFHESSTITQWKVALDPINHRINHFEFSFSLALCRWLNLHHEIVADRIAVGVDINGALVERKDVSNYRFSLENNFMYFFRYNVFPDPQINPHLLIIEIEIDLPYRETREVGNELYFEDDDLRWLSGNLGQLLTNPQYYQYFNMNLIPAYNQPPIPAHSYIIDTRWNQFFIMEGINTENINTVETHISRHLLYDILTYLYTGTFAFGWPNWGNVSYTTELFQVINKYKLYHLYKVFVKNDFQQVLVTRNPEVSYLRMCPLNRIDGSSILDGCYSWGFSQSPGYVFMFRMRVKNENGALPWLSYSLKSGCQTTVHAQVSLQVVKKVQNDYQRIFSLHECVYTIAPNGLVMSGPVLFLGCPETFGFNSPNLGVRREIALYFIRIYLKFSNGTTISILRSADGNTLQRDVERFNVLSNHMRKLKEEKAYSDMRILAHSRDPDEYQDNIHKAIFAARALNWREGLENASLENEIPENARSILSSETLSIVVDYMYTGKVPQIPDSLLKEIEHFARITWFYPLLDLVRRIRKTDII